MSRLCLIVGPVAALAEGLVYRLEQLSIEVQTVEIDSVDRFEGEI